MVQFRQIFLLIILTVFVASGLEAAKTMAKPKTQAQVQENELDGVYRWLKQSFSGIASSPTSLDGLKNQFFTTPEIIAMETMINSVVDHEVKVDESLNQVQAANAQDSIKRSNEALAKAVRTKTDRMLLVYDLFAKQKPLSWDDSAQAQMSQHSFEDLDFFATAKNFHSTLFNQATVHTLAGRARMAYEMANPTADIAVIK